MKLQELKQEEIMPSDDEEEEVDNIFEREMGLVDQELRYLNKKKSDEQEEDRELKHKGKGGATSSDEGEASDLESQQSKRFVHHQYSHSKELLVDKGELL
jgi:hypothetical protein